MATVPNPATFSAGQLVTAATMNAQLRDNLNFLLNPPAANIYLTNDTSIANTTATNLSGFTEAYDTDGMYSTGNPDRLTVVTPGIYHISAQVRYVSNTTGYRGVLVRKNTNALMESYIMAANGQVTVATLAGDARLVAGDYIQLQARQGSGAALTVAGVNLEYTYLHMRWVSK